MKIKTFWFSCRWIRVKGGDRTKEPSRSKYYFIRNETVQNFKTETLLTLRYIIDTRQQFFTNRRLGSQIDRFTRQRRASRKTFKECTPVALNPQPSPSIECYEFSRLTDVRSRNSLNNNAFPRVYKGTKHVHHVPYRCVENGKKFSNRRKRCR